LAGILQRVGTGGVFKHDDPAFLGGGACRRVQDVAMNAISLFGASPSAGVWFGILLVLSALSMASAPPEWRWQIRQPRTIPLCLPASGLLGLAMASTMAAIMRPELFAAAFGVI
jgi:uncharacterized membrane protein